MKRYIKQGLGRDPEPWSLSLLSQGRCPASVDMFTNLKALQSPYFWDWSIMNSISSPSPLSGGWDGTENLGFGLSGDYPTPYRSHLGAHLESPCSECSYHLGFYKELGVLCQGLGAETNICVSYYFSFVMLLITLIGKRYEITSKSLMWIILDSN